jgi:hypothetical protein
MSLTVKKRGEIVIKVILIFFLITYLTEISSLHKISNLLDRAILSLFITYGSVTLSNVIYRKAESLFKWLFVTSHI